jgi:hydroxymethylpyrimidine/phosphomethylpyrimidine kinase
MDSRSSVMLAIAGSDSGAGAGLQADLKSAAAIGVYAVTVVTAITAQSTTEVRRVHPMSATLIAEQLDVLWDDMRIGAVKIGLLPTRAAVAAVASRLARWGLGAVVLDPVISASIGGRLAPAAVVAALRRRLLPLTRVVTPNRAELEALTARPAGGLAERRDAARALLGDGVEWVLAKGGHDEGPEAVDLLIGRDEEREYRAPRIRTANGHGTGCTLSSAIAAGLASGSSVPTAVENAKAFLTEGLRAADRLRLGAGPGPVHHFHRWWPATGAEEIA